MPNPHTLDVDALINILYRVVYYVLDQHFLYIILHRAFANIFYVIFIPEGRAKAAVGGQFASFLNFMNCMDTHSMSNKSFTLKI